MADLTPEALAATMTPGRAAHKAFWDAVGPELAGQPRDWTWETSQLRDHWEAAARAAQLSVLPKHLGHPDDQAEAWLSEQYEDPGPEGTSYDREDIQGAYRAGVAEARRQLAPAHAALTGQLAEAYRDLAATRQYRDQLRADCHRYRAALEQVKRTAEYFDHKGELNTAREALEGGHG